MNTERKEKDDTIDDEIVYNTESRLKINTSLNYSPSKASVWTGTS